MSEEETLVENLARVLHDKMEHLDPSYEEQDWDRIDDDEKQFYRSCIRRLAMETALWNKLWRMRESGTPGDVT